MKTEEEIRKSLGDMDQDFSTHQEIMTPEDYVDYVETRLLILKILGDIT